MDYQKYIRLEPGKRSGQPCIRGLRITVADVLDYQASGMTEAEILRDFPELAAEDIVSLHCLWKAMTYKGTVSKGVVILPPEANLPDGAQVRVEPIEEVPKFESVFKKLSTLDSTIRTLPEDFAENHDHYIHGTPKRETP